MLAPGMPWFRAAAMAAVLTSGAHLCTPGASAQPVAGVATTGWRPLGPVDNPTAFSALSIDPRDPRVMVAVSPNAGLWRSVDGGTSWFPLDAAFEQLSAEWRGSKGTSTGTMARNPLNADMVVAGLGGTLLRSIDGGATWSVLERGARSLITSLDWGADGTLWRGMSGALWKSTDEGRSFQIPLYVGCPVCPFQGVAITPSRPRTVIAAPFITTDSGISWSQIPTLSSNQSYSRAVFAPSDPSIAYVVGSGNLLKSTDGGATFKVQSSNRYFSTVFPQGLWVNPTDAAHVLVANADQGLWSIEETRDGGLTFARLPSPTPPADFVSGQSFFFVEKPGYNGATNASLYAVTPGGIFRTDNANAIAHAGWTALNTNLATAIVTSATGVASTGTLFATIAGRGLLRSSGNGAWTSVSGPGGSSLGQAVVNQLDPSVVYAQDSAGMVRSRTAGQTFAERIAPGTALAFDPVNPDLLVAANPDLARSLNARSDTPAFDTILAARVTFVGHSRARVTDLFPEFAIAPSRPATAWAVRIGSDAVLDLVRSDDFHAAVPRWTAVAMPFAPRFFGPQYHLTIDPADSRTVYLTISGGQADNVYRTRDAGATWTDISGPTPSAQPLEVSGEVPPNTPVHALAVHPDRSSWLYAATDAGVYASDNDGATWTFAGPTRAPVVSLFWMGRTLVAATGGRGMYSIDLSSTAPPAASMTVDQASLTFDVSGDPASFTSPVPPQEIRVTQSGLALAWTATANQPWLTVTSASSFGSATLTVRVNLAGGVPPSGSATGAIVITAPGATNIIEPVTVTLNLLPGGTRIPFGSFDLPPHGASNLSGAIAVTGWALDDVGIDRIEIWRDRQPGETTPPFAGTPTDSRTGKVFVGATTPVEGGRPDVAAAYPYAPFSNRAGWGYLMLTQGLWNGGNGTYTLHAYAFDRDGRAALLGTKIIDVANAVADRPFGNIDTPAPGAIVSGTFVNFGWALTPAVNGTQTCRVPAGGVQVSIDSGPLRPVAYGDARPDIAAAFPALSNAAAAGGHFLLDTTTLANGVHTIGWLITDGCGRSAGVGSRFFTVINGASSPMVR